MISRPAVSRHLRVLRDSGLVHDELVGRRRFYVPDVELVEWLAQFVAHSGWEQRLDALETEVYGPARNRTHRAADQGKETRHEPSAHRPVVPHRHQKADGAAAAREGWFNGTAARTPSRHRGRDRLGRTGWEYHLDMLVAERDGSPTPDFDELSISD